jgi:D-alanyl-D-alanine carboxypeptidase
VAEPKVDEHTTACLERFYKEMNSQAKILNLKKSHYASAHGMYVEKNVSSALDVAKLSSVMMKDELFRQVVKTEYRECSSVV